MTRELIIQKLAFVASICNNYPICARCYQHTEKEVNDAKYIDTDLIEKVANVIANINGDYAVTDIMPKDLDFAFRLLLDLVPLIEERINGNPNSTSDESHS